MSVHLILLNGRAMQKIPFCLCSVFYVIVSYWPLDCCFFSQEAAINTLHPGSWVCMGKYTLLELQLLYETLCVLKPVIDSCQIASNLRSRHPCMGVSIAQPPKNNCIRSVVEFLVSRATFKGIIRLNSLPSRDRRGDCVSGYKKPGSSASRPTPPAPCSVPVAPPHTICTKNKSEVFFFFNTVTLFNGLII